MKSISGEYIYLLNGEPTGVVETFTVEHADGAIKSLSTRDARVFGTVINVETVERDGRLITAAIECRFNDVTIVAAYEFGDNSFAFRRSRNDGELVDNGPQPLPPDALFFPLMRVFQGRTILTVAESRREIPVIVPFIENPNALARLLTPTVDLRTAELTSESNGLRVFKYLSKHYDDKSEFVIREDGLLASYRFPQAEDKLWKVLLKQSDSDQ